MQWTDDYGVEYDVTLRGENLDWSSTYDDYGREISTRKIQSFDSFWQRGCAMDTYPTYRSTVTQAVMDWICRETGRPTPRWWKPLSPLQNQLVHVAAAAQNGAKQIQKLVADGAIVVDGFDGWGLTPVWWAAYYGEPETAIALLRAGADPHRLYPDAPAGYGTLLHGGVSRGRGLLLEALFERKVDPNAPDSTGRPPLLYVQREPYYNLFNSAEITRLLLAAGANPNHQAPNGETPLSYAHSKGLKEMAEILIKAGAS